jgi:hypothetical protein
VKDERRSRWEPEPSERDAMGGEGRGGMRISLPFLFSPTKGDAETRSTYSLCSLLPFLHSTLEPHSPTTAVEHLHPPPQPSSIINMLSSSSSSSIKFCPTGPSSCASTHAQALSTRRASKVRPPTNVCRFQTQLTFFTLSFSAHPPRWLKPFQRRRSRPHDGRTRPLRV